MSRSARVVALLCGLGAGAALVAFYIVSYLMVTPPAVASANGRLTLQTVASLGVGPHPDWVSYLARDSSGRWVHSTVLHVPANALVHVTVYQFDTATGLRNPYWGGPRGVVGGVAINGKRVRTVDPDLVSHTFAIPDLGVSVPLVGIPDAAKNKCSVAPCSLATAHQTIAFTFRTGKPGTYRWQCFVPCAFKTILGFGGPMQSFGYMDGRLVVA